MKAEALVPKLGRIAANAEYADVGKCPVTEGARRYALVLAQMSVTGLAQEGRDVVGKVDFSRDITQQYRFIATDVVGPRGTMRGHKKARTVQQAIVADAGAKSSSIKGPIYIVPYQCVAKYTIVVILLGRESFETHKGGRT
jgi:hypothetical protein